MKERTYFCIDMKSFFASVECAERGLNPFETNLIVADESRGNGTICLAITPKMKSLGVRNRCRRYEIPKGIQYITAMPRMQKYIDYAAEIYGIYLQYIDKQDIHVYSIDESFIDATDYLPMYHKTPKEFAKMLIDEIAEKLHIPATAGIGTNLYLAKIALDITAKKVPDHMGYLNEELFRETLWHHRPLTDFWGISTGMVRRLERRGIVDMEGIANYPSEILYKDFGINAELLIDHSWGRESCLMSDIKNYKSKSKSVSSSQVLFSDYTFDKAKIVVEEMVRSGCLELMRRKVIASHITVTIGYSKDCHAPTGGRVKIGASTNLPKKIMPSAMRVTQLLRLSQCTGGFIRDDATAAPQTISTAKIEALEDIIDNCVEEDKKVVVFARFVPEIEAIKAMLEKKKLGYRLIYGATKDRTEQVKDFQEDPDVKVFVGQLQTTRMGLTLTAASVAVFYSLDFSYANYEQSRARIHRIGQKEKCLYIHLVAKNTVDEKIMNALKHKGDIAKLMVDNWRTLLHGKV